MNPNQSHSYTINPVKNGYVVILPFKVEIPDPTKDDFLKKLNEGNEANRMENCYIFSTWLEVLDFLSKQDRE